MKRSIQLLTGLIALIIASIFTTKYQLKIKYDAIDKTNPYYSFTQIDGLNFSHINIIGGNSSHVFIESSEKSNLLIEQYIFNAISYIVKSDTLFINYNGSQTGYYNKYGENWTSKNRAEIIIQSNAVKSVFAEDASIGLELNKQENFNATLIGESKLEILLPDKPIKNLSIESKDNSQLKLNSLTARTSIAVLSINLHDNSIAELYNIEADSTIFQLDSASRISTDSKSWTNLCYTLPKKR